MSSVVTEKDFEQAFMTRLGEHYERALLIFKNYGKRLSFDFTNVLMHAVDKGKVEEVLSDLEEHWETHLQFQHPDIHGAVEDNLLGTNDTKTMFLGICRNHLGLGQH